MLQVACMHQNFQHDAQKILRNQETRSWKSKKKTTEKRLLVIPALCNLYNAPFLHTAPKAPCRSAKTAMPYYLLFTSTWHICSIKGNKACEVHFCFLIHIIKSSIYFFYMFTLVLLILHYIYMLKIDISL